MVRWARIASSSKLLEETLPLIVSHPTINGQADASLHIDGNRVFFLLIYLLHQNCLCLYLKYHCVLFFADTLVRHVVSKQTKKSANNVIEHLNRQITYQKDHGLSSLADVPLHIEGNLVLFLFFFNILIKKIVIYLFNIFLLYYIYILLFVLFFCRYTNKIG